MISGFNTEREVAQLRIAQEYHLERIEEIKQYIAELEESMAPASGKTEKMYTFIKLGRRVDYHKKRMAEIAARICLLRKEAEQQDKSVEVRQCNGTTVDGDPCGALIRDPDEDERFCDPHKGQQDKRVEDLDLFNPDDWPPQFHIDNLEMQLDFNLGQVYRFDDLDKQSQADLAKLAVEYELDQESTQNILNICRALGSLDGDRD